MDKKFHINSAGDVKPCAASKVSCQFGDSTLHFENAQQARALAEEILSQAVGNERSLTGKKKSLADLRRKANFIADGGNHAEYKPLKESATKPAEAQEAPRKRTPAPRRTSGASSGLASREKQFMEKSAGSSYTPVPIYSVPSEVKSMFQGNLPAEEELRGVLMDYKGDYKAVTYSKKSDTFTAWEGIPTRDIPMKMTLIGGWSSSLHARGPKISYRCRCGASGAQRAGDFPVRRQGDFRIRCSECGQMGTVPIGAA